MQQKFRLLGRSAVLPQVDSSCLGYGGGQKRSTLSGGDRPPSLHGRPARPTDHPHERREQAFRLPALAERLQRAILQLGSPVPWAVRCPRLFTLRLARTGCPASCSGRARTASTTSATCSGRSSVKHRLPARAYCGISWIKASNTICARTTSITILRVSRGQPPGRPVGFCADAGAQVRPE